MIRPSIFNQSTVNTICSRIAAGESLRTICADEAMPASSTVYRWLIEIPGFSEQYARAREEQADFYAEQIVEIADEEVTTVRRSKHNPFVKEGSEDDDDVEVVFDSAAVARNRLRVDARKWYASKLAPKKYGDKLDLNHGGKVVLQKTDMTDDELLALAAGRSD